MCLELFISFFYTQWGTQINPYKIEILSGHLHFSFSTVDQFRSCDDNRPEVISAVNCDVMTLVFQIVNVLEKTRLEIL